jgi:hypothetical protein
MGGAPPLDNLNITDIDECVSQEREEAVGGTSLFPKCTNSIR